MQPHSLIPLDLRDIRFKQAPVLGYGSRGTPYFRWVPYGMPQLGQYKPVMDTVFFLYPTEEDARSGTEYGGTGFLVAVPSKRWPDEYYHVHGVTNWHVIAGKTCASVIRINRRDSGVPETFPFDPSEWTFKGFGWHDIAISPPLRLDPNVHKAGAVGLDTFLTRESEVATDINAADDVFMIGRFVDYDGVETNVPSFRFGNISIMDAKVKQKETNFSGRSIVVDMHSRTGYSGSPVFVYRTPGSVFAPNVDLMMSWHFIRLVGILWGVFPEIWEIRESASTRSTWERIRHFIVRYISKVRPPFLLSNQRPPAAQASMITDGKYVKGLSGMSCVIPAANIIELLAHPELVARREEIELQITPQMERRSLHPMPMAGGGPPTFKQ